MRAAAARVLSPCAMAGPGLARGLVVRAAMPMPRVSAARPLSSHAPLSLPPLPATPTPAFPGEPDGISMGTAVPGPVSTAQLEELTALQESGAVHFHFDPAASRGNYIVDSDGNTMLDVFGHIGSLPIGYNHPRMREVFTREENLPLLMHRPALGNLPPTGWAARLKDTLMSVAPAGMDQVTQLMCGSCANENAFKVAFMRKANELRGGSGPREVDMTSCMTHEEPGTPPLTILSFEGSFHGRLVACLSATNSKAIHKVDVPAFDWPRAPFPRLRYPLHEHAVHNDREESASLEAARAQIRAYAAKGRPVAACIVEPIQAEGGDRHASPQFFQALRQLTKEEGVALIVDEVQTGCGPTGRMWAHEAWDLPADSPPDIVTFSKKMQCAGFYTARAGGFRPDGPYRTFNTWWGDPTRLLQAEAVLDTIAAESLLDNTRIAGEYALDGLAELMARHGAGKIANARGVGTFIAFDCAGPAARDALIGAMRQRGVEVGGCGEVSVRMRPALVFQPKHAAEFLQVLDDALAAQ